MATKATINAGKVLAGTLKMLDKTGIQSLTKVDSLTQKIRYAMCKGCPKFIADETVCDECGCEMNFKTSLYIDPVKSLIAGQEILVSCPDNKW